MDGENNGKPYEQMDDLGGNTHIFGLKLKTHMSSTAVFVCFGGLKKTTEEYNAFLRHETLRIAVLGIFECSKERVASEEAKVEQEDGLARSNWGMSPLGLEMKIYNIYIYIRIYQGILWNY